MSSLPYSFFSLALRYTQDPLENLAKEDILERLAGLLVSVHIKISRRKACPTMAARKRVFIVYYILTKLFPLSVWLLASPDEYQGEQ